jgi:hypothetical protein
MTVYLLCFRNDAGEHTLLSGHAGHYMGETDKPIGERRDEHQAGRGAKLTAAAAAAGITFVVARTWPGRYAEERRLKGRPKGSRELKELCPCCHPMPRIDRWAGGEPGPARQADPGGEDEVRQRRGEHQAPTQERPARPDPYLAGVRMGEAFLAAQAGRSVSQIEATFGYVAGAYRAEPRHAAMTAEAFRGWQETVTRAVTQLREREQQAEATPEPELEAAS